jgi:cytochrome bd ubiquinol oxidase subunit II
MELQLTWFILWSVLWAVYFMLDGFVLGTGMLYYILGKNRQEKQMLLQTIGPVWNGNEVWLVTAGGATFAAFPTTYALMFSYLYTALLLLLFALIIRGVSIELHNKGEGASWMKRWDIGIFIGSFLPALLFGVAFGNIFKGLPMDATGYHGSLLSLLNPYGLLTGALFLILFLVHGALYISVKTTGDVAKRAAAIAQRLWIFELIIAVSFLVCTYFMTRLYDNYFTKPILLFIPFIAVMCLFGIKLFSTKGAMLKAFLSSCGAILFVVFTGVTGLFPNLIPSSLDPRYSMTITNSSSSHLTLSVMTVVALIFVPIVIAYKIWVYRIFRAPVTKESVIHDASNY